MSAALPEPSPGNTVLANLQMLLGEVVCEWRGDINRLEDGDVNNAACIGNTFFYEHCANSDAQFLQLPPPYQNQGNSAAWANFSPL